MRFQNWKYTSYLELCHQLHQVTHNPATQSSYDKSLLFTLSQADAPSVTKLCRRGEKSLELLRYSITVHIPLSIPPRKSELPYEVTRDQHLGTALKMDYNTANWFRAVDKVNYFHNPFLFNQPLVYALQTRKTDYVTRQLKLDNVKDFEMKI